MKLTNFANTFLAVLLLFLAIDAILVMIYLLTIIV